MIYLRKPKDFRIKFDIVSCYIEYDGKTLFLLRHPQKPEGSKWDRPAGKVSPGESLIDATVRETQEEIGVKLEHSDLKDYKKVYVRYPTYDYVFHMFRASLTQPIQITLNDEHVEYRWLKPEEALALTLIRDEDACVKLFYGIKSTF